MSKYDFAKRLKVLFIRERKLVRKEISLADKANKCEVLLTQILDYFIKSWRYEKKMHLQLEQLQKRNVDIKLLLKSIEEFVRTQQMHCQEVEKQHQAQIEKREENLQFADKLHWLEKMSQVYLKFSELPTRIKGVVVCQTVDGRQWRTFDIDPMQHTREEVEELIWNKIQHAQYYEQKWHELFFDTTTNIK